MTQQDPRSFANFNPFHGPEPEDGEFNLDLIIPKMQARIRDLEAMVEALIVTQYVDPVSDDTFATNSRRMLTQRAQRILKEKE